MKDVFKHLNLAVVELIWLLMLQGIFLLVFAALILFYPWVLYLAISFLLICLAVISMYFGLKIWSLKCKIDKLLHK